MTHVPEDLILKYLRGTLSPREREQFESWLDQSDDHHKMVSDFQTIWQASDSREKNIDFGTEKEWSRLQASLAGADSVVSGTRFRTNTYFLRIAASIAFLLIASFVLYTLVFRGHDVIHETTSKVEQVILPDGSTLWLNERSRIIYDRDFRNGRNITLEGEGFFEVKPDSGKPFIIHTGQAQIRVLGTSFNVKAFGEEILTEVFVVTGKVTLSPLNSNNSLVLTPGSNGVLNKHDQKVTIQHSPPLNITAWKDRNLIFRKTPLREVVRTLRHFFKTDIRVKNEKLLDCRFTSTFNDPTLPEVIETISVAMDLQVDHQSNAYTLDGEGCKTN